MSQLEQKGNAKQALLDKLKVFFAPCSGIFYKRVSFICLLIVKSASRAWAKNYDVPSFFKLSRDQRNTDVKKNITHFMIKNPIIIVGVCRFISLIDRCSRKKNYLKVLDFKIIEKGSQWVSSFCETKGYEVISLWDLGDDGILIALFFLMWPLNEKKNVNLDFERMGFFSSAFA